MTDFPHSARPFAPSGAAPNPLHGALFATTRRIFAALGRAIRHNFETRAAQRATRRRIRRIERLDERMLNDIGFTRADLDYGLSRPWAHDDTLSRHALSNREDDLARPRLRAR